MYLMYFCLCCRVIVAATLVEGRILDASLGTVQIGNRKHWLRQCERRLLPMCKLDRLEPVLCRDCIEIPRDNTDEVKVKLDTFIDTEPIVLDGPYPVPPPSYEESVPWWKRLLFGQK